jgi:hypothetical protein
MYLEREGSGISGGLPTIESRNAQPRRRQRVRNCLWSREAIGFASFASSLDAREKGHAPLEVPKPAVATVAFIGTITKCQHDILNYGAKSAARN